MRILIVRDCARGDVLLTTPATRFLREKYPDAEIYYLTNKTDGDVLIGNPNINKIIYFGDKHKAQNFDLLIDFRDKEGIHKIPFTGTKTVLARDLPYMRTDLKSRIERSKMGVPFAYQYAEIAGVGRQAEEHPNLRLDIQVGDVSKLLKKNGINDGDHYIAVSFCSFWKSKAYPNKKAKELCRLLSQHYKVVILGKHTPWSQIGGHNIVNLCCKTDVMQLAGIIKRSKLFIGIDSLPMHIADAVDVPMISIWTATDPRSIITNGSRNKSIESCNKCHPCYLTECRYGRGCFPGPETLYQEAMSMLKNETRPVTWIAMPTMGQVRLTTQAIVGLFEKKNDLPFHLILIDNGSPPEDRDALIELNKKYQFTLIRNEENIGFVGATNQGIEHGLKNSTNIPNDYALWLNNDVIIERDGWLDALVRASSQRNVVGPQGSRLKNDFSHAGWINYGSPVDPHYIDGWCLFAPLRYYREEEVGLLDRGLFIFSEDADWCLRAARAGHRITLAKVPIKHLGHKSYKLFNASEKCRESAKYMRDKYGTLDNALSAKVETPVVDEKQAETIEVVEKEFKANERIPLSCWCGRDDDIHLGTVDGFDIVKCSCGQQRVSNVTNPIDLAKHYDKSLHLRMSPQWMKNVEKTQSGYWVEADRYDIRTMQKRGKWLDVGCNLGVMVEKAKKFGWDAIGSDFAPEFVKKCQQKGLNVILGSGLNGQVRGPIQVISMFDMIEHDPEPLKTLMMAFELLDPKGFLMLTTPDHGCALARKLGLRYEHIRPIEHLWHFTTATITRLMETAGFAVDEIRNADCHVDYTGNRLYFGRKV